MKHIRHFMAMGLLISVLTACSETDSSGEKSLPDLKDPSFGQGGYRKSEFIGNPILIDGRDIDVHPDGTIVMAGAFDTVEVSYKQVGITLMDASGTLIQSFGNGGQLNTIFPLDTIAEDVAFQGDNIIIVARRGSKTLVARIDQTGNFDPDFRDEGSFIEERNDGDYGYTIQCQGL